MAITRKDVEHVAVLARLELTEEEKDLYTKQLGRILGHVETISKADTSSVAKLGTKSTERLTPLRPDTVAPSLDRDAALGNSPESADGCFKVPKVIE
ncbi:MAG: Asp-tRNA(Asn)/Glu-tRNA(Gln) amidotransferase subunit GatC [Deltaproteobacteria bacterium]|nr:Asp-tRNA(Asn)/Glu-tRNA(Gln) amidotransferase subunit GatC [Deltaproteobacteria bacterium]